MTYPEFVARVIRQVLHMEQQLLTFRSTCVHARILVVFVLLETLATFHLYVAIFQQHLHMERISLR